MTTPSSRTVLSGFDQFFTGKIGEGGRVRTGIAELEEMPRGGFMEGSAVMVKFMDLFRGAAEKRK